MSFKTRVQRLESRAGDFADIATPHDSRVADPARLRRLMEGLTNEQLRAVINSHNSAHDVAGKAPAEVAGVDANILAEMQDAINTPPASPNP